MNRERKRNERGSGQFEARREAEKCRRNHTYVCDQPSDSDDSDPNTPSLDGVTSSMLRVLREDLEEDGSRCDEGIQHTNDEDGGKSECRGRLSVFPDERSVSGSGGEEGSGVSWRTETLISPGVCLKRILSFRNELTIDDGTRDGKENELSGHTEIQRFREVLWLFHVSNERGNES